MKRLLALWALAALLAAGAGPAAAELVLESVGWQAGRAARPPRPPSFEDASSAPAPTGRGPARLRGKAVLKNRGPESEEGILLRYVVAARLMRPAAAGEGVWTVPFLVEERRVPKIGANQILSVPLITSPHIEQYLRRTARQGYVADRLRLEAMVEPHGKSQLRVLSAELEVTR